MIYLFYFSRRKRGRSVRLAYYRHHRSGQWQWGKYNETLQYVSHLTQRYSGPPRLPVCLLPCDNSLLCTLHPIRRTKRRVSIALSLNASRVRDGWVCRTWDWKFYRLNPEVNLRSTSEESARSSTLISLHLASACVSDASRLTAASGVFCDAGLMICRSKMYRRSKLTEDGNARERIKHWKKNTNQLRTFKIFRCVCKQSEN